MKNIDYKLLSDRVDERITARANSSSSLFFILNLLLYILYVIVCVGTVGGSPRVNIDGSFDSVELALIYACLGWGLCILFHGANVMINNPRRLHGIHRQIAEQELGKMAIEAMESDSWEEKPKRHSVYDSAVEMELSDDGEFVIDEVLEARQVRHKSR